MRRDEPGRHGRAADALISTYLRELLADEQLGEPSSPAAEPLRAEPQLPAPLVPLRDEPRVEATL